MNAIIIVIDVRTDTLYMALPVIPVNNTRIANIIKAL